MWKRLNNARGARPQISDPVAIDNFMENPYGNSGLGIVPRRPTPQDGGYQSTTSAHQQEDSMPRGLPRLPFEPVQPPQAHQNQHSDFRPASSIYSQPSPNPIVTHFPRNHYQQNQYTNEVGVSPPSSPEYGTSRNQRQSNQIEDTEVSPIEEMPDVSRLELSQSSGIPNPTNRSPASNIPVLRREVRRNQVAAQASASSPSSRKEVGDRTGGRKVVDPRWDPYSGEITTSDRGKPQSVKPKEFTAPGLRSVHQQTGLPLGNVSSITAGTDKVHTSFSDRVRKLKSKNEVQGEKPRWKGATGRVTLVAPVADRHDLPPLSMPRRKESNIVSPQSETYSGSLTPVTIIRSRDDETGTASARPDEFDYPSRSMHEDERYSPRTMSSPTSETSDSVVVTPPVVKTFTRGNTPVSEVPPTTRPRKDSTGAIERNFREALKEVSVHNESADPYVQPPSRFSVTTYAPSEAQTTPRPSTDTWERPPVSTPPQMFEPTQQSVLNRRRPQIGEVIPPSISRKAINPGAPLFISMTSSVATKRLSSSTAKDLPITPAEAQSHDLVTSLQAQLDDLAHRRINITRGIRQMTELMPKDHIILTDDVRRKREAEKIKVEALRVEEADIKREEHEIGLRLHRAWKRRDKGATYEPTGLWVRRVTG